MRCVVMSDINVNESGSAYIEKSIMKVKLLHCPGLGSAEHHVAQRREALLGFHFLHLAGYLRLVGGRRVVADHSEGERQGGAVHHGQLLVEEIVLAVRVVHEHVVDRVALFSDCHGFEPVAVEHEAFVIVFAEDHFLAVAEGDAPVSADFLVGEPCVDAMVEYHAVLKHFYHCRAFMTSCSHHYLAGDVERDVEASGKEFASCAKHELSRDKRVFGCAVW